MVGIFRKADDPKRSLETFLAQQLSDAARDYDGRLPSRMPQVFSQAGPLPRVWK